MTPNAPVQRRAAQRTVRCNRLLGGDWHSGFPSVETDTLQLLQVEQEELASARALNLYDIALFG
jgi:hypothetical protein